MAEYGVATISVLMPHRRLRPRAADLPRPWNTTQPSPINATHIGKRLAGKLHEPFERAGGGRAISPTSPDSTPEKRPNKEGLPSAEVVEGRTPLKGNGGQTAAVRTQRRGVASNGLTAVGFDGARPRFTLPIGTR